MLSPLPVAPGRRRQGIGGTLLPAAVTEAERLGAPVVFLEGDPPVGVICPPAAAVPSMVTSRPDGRSRAPARRHMVPLTHARLLAERLAPALAPH